MTATNLDDITELLLDQMVNSDAITYDKRHIIKSALSKRHRHIYEENSVFGGGKNTNADFNRKVSQKGVAAMIKTVSDMGMVGQEILSKFMNYLIHFSEDFFQWLKIFCQIAGIEYFCKEYSLLIV